MEVWVLSDGKPGHLSQSLGLANALLDRVPGHLTTIDVSQSSMLNKIRTVRSKKELTPPSIIIGTGHGTHLPLIAARHYYKVPAVVCMKPSLPSCLFDLVVAPRHDFPAHKQHPFKNYLPTIGAIHGIKPSTDKAKKHTLILIGGISKEYDCNPQTLAKLLTDTIEPGTEGDIILTTSRRTPADFTDILKNSGTDIQIVPFEDTKPGWVAEHLSEAKAVWVTEDSVSMVYEALGSGSPVGIIPMPRKSPKQSRVSYGLSLLIEEKRVETLEEWAKTRQFHPQQDILQEADRTAEYIIRRFPNITHH